MRNIPVEAAEHLAGLYGADQIVIIARGHGENSGEQVVTFGQEPQDKYIAASIGLYLREKIMGWDREHTTNHGSKTIAAVFGDWLVISDPKIPEGFIEFRHPDGRVDQFNILTGERG